LENLLGQPFEKKNHLSSMKFSAFETRLDSVFKRYFMAIRLVTCFFQKKIHSETLFNRQGTSKMAPSPFFKKHYISSPKKKGEFSICRNFVGRTSRTSSYQKKNQ
jgi:hypothetical protein